MGVYQVPDEPSITNDEEAWKVLTDKLTSIVEQINKFQEQTNKALKKPSPIIQNNEQLADAYQNLEAAIIRSNKQFETQAVKISNTNQKLIRSLRHKPSGHFAKYPEAIGNFQTWFNTSPLTKGKNGKHTHKKLAELMHIDNVTAGEYVRGSNTPTIWAMINLEAELKEATGSNEEFYDALHGAGAYSRIPEKAEKEIVIGAIHDLLSDDYLMQLSLSKLNELRAHIEIETSIG